MKCFACGNPMLRKSDRFVCVICGHSRWNNFQIRRPIGLEKGRMGETHRRFSKGSRV